MLYTRFVPIAPNGGEVLSGGRKIAELAFTQDGPSVTTDRVSPEELAAVQTILEDKAAFLRV